MRARSFSGRRRVGASLAGVVTAAGLLAAVGVHPASAVVPGVNGLIAFESNRYGDNDIFVMNADGTIEQDLTNNPANDVFPAWSNDSTKITFSSDRAQAGNLDVYVMNRNGSGVTQLTNSPGEDRGTSWTSDGQKIIFHSARDRDASHTFDVFKMDANGSNPTKLFSNGSAAYVCGSSTTGRIVFNSSADPTGGNPQGDFEIFSMDMNGGNVTQLTNNTVLDSGPKWSPDCQHISYNSLDSGGSLDVHRMDANGTNDRNLTNAPGVFDAFSAWAPAGDKIVFSSDRDVNFELYTMGATDGSDVTRLTFTKKGEADLRSDWGTAPNRQIPPDNANQCKNGGWQDFTTPAFPDQGTCVTYVNEHTPPGQ